LDPGYAYGRRPYQNQRGCRQHRIKRAEEMSADPETDRGLAARKWFDGNADEIQSQRDRNQIHPVRSAPRAVWRAVAAATKTLARAAGASDNSPT